MTTRNYSTPAATLNSLQRKRDLFPEIRSIDSIGTCFRSFAMMGINRKNSDNKTLLADPIIHRKLRRRKGASRAYLNPCDCSISTGRSLLLLLALLLQGLLVDAYLNGANPNSKLPTKTSVAPPKNQRYTFLTSNRDRHFTSTGILPPLSPSPDSERARQALISPLPPRKSLSDSKSLITEKDVLVTYTNDPNTVDEWLCRNVPFDGCFLGFDIERLPENRSKNPHAADRYSFAHAAVVQLATPTACLVIHLVDSSSGSTHHKHHPRHSNSCARILRTVLEDPSIIKAGCSIDEDLVFLHELWDKYHSSSANSKKHKKKIIHISDSGKNHRRTPKAKKQKISIVPALQARSRFDLGCVVLPKKHSVADADALKDIALEGDTTKHSNHHYKIVAKQTTTIPNKSGLRGLCEYVLGVDLPKEKSKCASDWTQFPLTDDQITYAARDAWAGVAIAAKLASMNVEPDNENMYKNVRHKNKNNVFSRPNLAKVLRKVETPLPELAQRHRQRKEAKNELHTLLHPYSHNLPLYQKKQHRDQHHRRQTQTTTPHQGSNSTDIHSNDTIDVEALFASLPLSSRRTIVSYAQMQQQLMERSMPKQIRKRSIVLRQAVNAKVIDHNVIFEIDLVHPNNDSPSLKSSRNGNQQELQPQYRGEDRERRTHGSQD